MLLLFVAAAAVGLGAACNGRVHGPPVQPTPRAVPAVDPNIPTLRIYFLADLDGYLEPCGCQTRPLGGIDRIAEVMRREHAAAPNSVFVATGNLLFESPTVDTRMVFQETAKAESLVGILNQLRLDAFAPGPSDFARGADEWTRITRTAHFTPLAANVAPAATLGMREYVMREVGGTRIAIVGVSDFRPTPDAAVPAGAPTTADPVEAARAAVAHARRDGASVVIVLASVPRRMARTIAGDVAGVDFVVASRNEGESAPPPERIGQGFLVTAVSQGKMLGIVDVFVRPGARAWVDASEATTTAARTRLDARIAELRTRITAWLAEATVDRAAVAQQQSRLAEMERERAALSVGTAPPAGRSFFRARLLEIDPDVPKRHDVETSIASYFRTVNDHNHTAYADLHAPAAPPGTARYIGIEECRNCHEEAYDIWTRTPHSRAYHTLDAISKNFNLSCVGCHVTGYQRPGGSEVVQNAGLQDVQCETCHGPGSLHAAARTDARRRATIIRAPERSLCATQCHTPEHSDHFNYERYLPRILGPGHGFPVTSHGGGVSLTDLVIAGGANSDAGATDASADASAAAAPP